MLEATAMATQPKARIMVIDNDKRVGKDLTDLLQPQGYQIQSVNGIGANLLKRAMDTAKQFRPHVVITDIRLLDDYYLNDKSGLHLLPGLQSAKCILYSAHLTAETVGEAKYLVFDWVSKSDRPQKLIDAINKATSEISAQYVGQLIMPELDFIEMTQSLISAPGIDLVRDIIFQLFSESKKIELSTISGSMITMSEITHGRSVVCKVKSDKPIPSILKLGRAERIRPEQQNYDRYVRDELGGRFHTELKQGVEFWDLGGSVYSFISSTPQLNSFASHYDLTKAPEQILKSLRHFFEKVWREHYRNSKPLEVSLFTAYDKFFEFKNSRLAKITTNYSNFDHIFGINLGNVAGWLLEHPTYSIVHDARQAVTHGDLHGDNLFVDEDHAWVIDFDRTGWGPILRDFVELEIDILTRLLPKQKVSVATFHELVLILAEPRHPREALQLSAPLLDNVEAKKALAVIGGLRNIAASVTQYSEMQEYFWCLLLNALFVVSRESIDLVQRQRAARLSLVLWQRLKNWGKPWPPEESMEDDGEQTSDGNQMNSSPQDTRPPKLSNEDRRKLKSIIEAHPSWRHKTGGQRKSTLNMAGLPDELIGYLHFEGTSSDSDVLLDQLQLHRHLKDRPRYTALGTLAEYMLNESTELEGTLFLANLIVHHRLITDAKSMQEIESSYGIVYTLPHTSRTSMGWATQKNDQTRWNSQRPILALEKVWREKAKFLDVAFLEKGAKVARAVGRVESTDGQALGTGFLIAPNLILTNAHVIPHDSLLNSVQIRFGYRIDLAGRLQDGETYRVRHSLTRSSEDELDFVLIELDEAPGDNPEIGYLRPMAKQIVLDSPLYIIQHPNGKPQKVVLQENWVTYIASNHRRVQYLTNTEYGSSGSPAFDENWDLVAIHHSRAPLPPSALTLNIDGNEGIPMLAILLEIQSFLPYSFDE